MPSFSSREVIVLVHSKLTKVIGLLLLTAFALSAIGARCIENTAVRKDLLGRTHIYGEFYNDTDVQGVQIILSGKLFDAQGNIIAEAQAPICPPDTQPKSQSMFDIEFPEGIPEHASFEVRPIAGKALDVPLPDPDIVLLQTDSRRIGPFIGVAFGIRNRSQTTYSGLQGCAVMYDQAGKVVGADSGTVMELTKEGDLVDATLGTEFPELVLLLLDNLTQDAGQVRAWIWIAGPTPGTSPYSFVMSDKITVQPDVGP